MKDKKLDCKLLEHLCKTTSNLHERRFWTFLLEKCKKKPFSTWSGPN